MRRMLAEKAVNRVIHRLPVSKRRLAELHADPARQAWPNFQEMVHKKKPGTILEIGSRARSGNTYRDWIPKRSKYIGFDYYDGPNVDVVGDAHELSKHIEPNSIGAGFSISTYEHLAMPWLAAIELNKVMKMNGIFFIQSHQTWPVHDAPWDFFRFSKYSWHALFNPKTGFRILASEHGDPTAIISKVPQPDTTGLVDVPGFGISNCIVRKVADTELSWDVHVSDFLKNTTYPTGEAGH